MAYPARHPGPGNAPQDDTVRLWLSQRQWMTVLQDTERKAQQPDASKANDLRQSPRVPAPSDMNCMIRLGKNTDQTGTFIVKLRDISATGLGFFSSQKFAAKSRCTVALQDADGHGMVCSASVVWSRTINETLNDVGIQFDKPIEAHWLAGEPTDRIPV